MAKRKKKHHLVLLQDRSGSMSRHVPVTIKGVNEFIATAKNVQKETKADIRLTLIGFETDTELMEGYNAVPIQKANKVTTTEIFGRGGTQMYDGVYFTINHLLSVVEEGDTVFVGIFTDGDTGGDRYNANQIKKLVEASGSTFAFLTPKSYREGDGARKGALMGIPASNVMEYEVSHGGFRSAFYKLARGTRKYLTRIIDSDGEFELDGFFDGVDPENATMKVNGLEITMNMPESIQGEDEKKDELPPYSPVSAYVVDEYPACPSHWMNGSSKAASYFVPVKEGHGMWIDFNKLQQDEHEIAVVISVQGINPITGQKTSALRLEKYDTKCPVHDKEFGQDHFCKDCGYKWPTQNYIATNATPNGQFWLDGFRTSDGKVRQYIFTEEQARGIAKAVIGDDRVFAIGIAFFKSKEKKPQNQSFGYLRDRSFDAGLYLKSASASMSLNATSSIRGSTARSIGSRAKLCSMRSATDNDVAQMQFALESVANDPNFINVTHHAHAGVDLVDGSVDQTVYQLGSQTLDMFAPAACSVEAATKSYVDAPVLTKVQTKSFEVGAGESIDQQVHADPNKMDYWQDEPYAMLYVNYADEESVKKILAAGKRKEAVEGFLAALPVGN